MAGRFVTSQLPAVLHSQRMPSVGAWQSRLSLLQCRNHSATPRPQSTVAELQLEDGTVFSGKSFGFAGPSAGEVVFNTGMVGYPESLTDPSYLGQILTMTYPLMGNYGVPDPALLDAHGLLKHVEASRVQVSGMIVSNLSEEYSHYEAVMSLHEWLLDNRVPGIRGIDTRALTKHIRSHGSMLGRIVQTDGPAVELPNFYDPSTENLVAKASRTMPQVYEPLTGSDEAVTILAVDCGMKESIIRQFLIRGARVKVVPWNHDISQEYYDGLFYSNGPGDPVLAVDTIKNLSWALTQDTPIFGICMGHQLMSLAAGGSTYKMNFGNRGQNQPCTNLEDQRCYITSQNHGYAVDAKSMPSEWQPLFVNANDGTNEGFIHREKPFFSVQFHPEAHAGPLDTMFLFDRYLHHVRKHKDSAAYRNRQPLGPVLAAGHEMESFVNHPMSAKQFPSPALVGQYPTPKKVLILGSGGLSIGQAGEFDYSGSQAIKALKESGVQSVLINPNIATVQTATDLADKVYLVPVTPEFVKEVIEKEQPDGIFLQFGGQTALNCGIELDKQGILMHHGVRVLGTSVSAIINTEDRKIFAQKLVDINEKIAPSIAANTTDAAISAAREIGFPVIVRAAFSLGGLGSGFAHDEEQLRTLCGRAFSTSKQVLVEKSLKGWKEVEYEVVRDSFDNCVTVCNMENFDPLGIHTGDSIVVAPSQTLSDDDYHRLRSASMRVARHFNIIGECNVQFALDPYSKDYCIIEANPRLSRSSALASKATGYPLAYIAAKLAMGENLAELRNTVTGDTTACFEPSLDYVVTKIPRWDLKKFNNVSTVLGSGMKSVGEVMAIGRTFEESFQKALRMVDPSNYGFEPAEEFSNLTDALIVPTERRPFAIASAMSEGYSIEKIHENTTIDRWFLSKLQNIFNLKNELTVSSLTPELMLKAKQLGFSDLQIARATSSTEAEIRKIRTDMKITPFVKQIDTLAAEFPARTNYLYTTYNADRDDIEFPSGGVMTIGSGVYRIGSSVEFDWSGVMCIRGMRKAGKKTITINYNPETVSTDFDESDRLYFEELSHERVMDIHDKEVPEGTVVSMGGQIANNMALPLHESGVKILGTSAVDIDRAEDRHKFSQLMDEIGVDQPEWSELSTLDDVKTFCKKVGYPVLVRPSYVLSGAAMNVVRTEADLARYLQEATEVSRDRPVVVSKFIEGAREIEIDAIADKGQIIVHAIAEHVEQAGTHSGDATLVLPCQELPVEVEERIYQIGCKVAKALNISGPMNAQFIVDDDENIKIIETNLRASRSLPFVSKVMGINFIDKAVDVLLEKETTALKVDARSMPYFGVKSPQFSWGRLLGADPVLGVEMASTGEVACFAKDEKEAFIKSLLASNVPLPKKNILLVLGEKTHEFLPQARSLAAMGYNLWADPDSADFLAQHGVAIARLPWPRGDNYLSDPHQPDVLHAIRNHKIDFCLSFPAATSQGSAPNNEEQRKTYRVRRHAIDHNIPVVTNLQVGQLLVDSLLSVFELGTESYQDVVAANDAARKATTIHAEPVDES